jgi:hypothetical protein
MKEYGLMEKIVYKILNKVYDIAYWFHCKYGMFTKFCIKVLFKKIKGV